MAKYSMSGSHPGRARGLVGSIAAAMLLVAGCGGAPSATSIGTRIVSNNSASFQAEARKGMAFGELDVEAIIRIAGKHIPVRPATRTPDHPTTPQPIRPRPQSSAGGTQPWAQPGSDQLDELDATTGQTLSYLEKVEDVIAFYPELADQGAFLAATPKTRVEAIRKSFRAELAGLGATAVADKEKAWRKATPETRLRLVVAKLADVTDLGPVLTPQ
ncbi:MAG: hypothetical protein FJZ01_10635 [Candidatus Sericytochromatia bacterium]|nr:hypothetical protein [Candidatus Tanganyikabacteria bacterium]